MRALIPRRSRGHIPRRSLSVSDVSLYARARRTRSHDERLDVEDDDHTAAHRELAEDGKSAETSIMHRRRM